MDELELHKTEFEVLMARNAIWITIQFSAIPAVIIFLTLVVIAWEGIEHAHAAFAQRQTHLPWWIALLGMELLILYGYFCLTEVHRAVGYVDEWLRPRIDTLLAEGGNPPTRGGLRCWSFEDYLEAQRGAIHNIFEWLPTMYAAGFCIALDVIVFRSEHPLERFDIWLFSLTAVVALILVGTNFTVTKMRRSHRRTVKGAKKT